MPGHSSIRENEEVDKEARYALQLLPARGSPPDKITLSFLRRLMHQRRQNLINDWWSSICLVRHQILDLKMRRRIPPGTLTFSKHTSPSCGRSLGQDMKILRHTTVVSTTVMLTWYVIVAKKHYPFI